MKKALCLLVEDVDGTTEEKYKNGVFDSYNKSVADKYDVEIRYYEFKLA